MGLTITNDKALNQGTQTMKSLKTLLYLTILFALLSLGGCSPALFEPVVSTPHPSASAQPGSTTPASPVVEPAFDGDMQLPVRFQNPSYLVKSSSSTGTPTKEDEVIIPVGADISSTSGPVELRDILKRLAMMKNMNVSWASDVIPSDMVDVDIRAEDDFFNAIDNLLRQKDYFHEVKGNTIIVKYKDTRKFHIAMPFLTSTYSTGVGGDVLGSSGADAGNIKGNIQLTSEGNTFDVWSNIQTNLDQVLGIWQEPVAAATPDTGASATPAQAGAKPATPATTRNVKDGTGYYSIDKPIGLITVTAPRPLLEKIENYINNLKEELYKQVAIEAKILEVKLDDTSTKGIDWSGMLSGKEIDFQLFGPQGIIYSTANTDGRGVSQVSLTNPFTMVLDFLDTVGDTKILANPRLSVMNGQPALISIGDSVAYVDSIETNISDSGIPAYTVNTDTVMSGLGMSVVATILDDDQIILSLTPVTSDLQEPIDYLNIGGGAVGLPKVRLRE
ncbi:MAG: type II and III secretion system protein, partial [Desulfobulbaceae bacterium]|nr:type II and III secretion system protein [Desulfobulbaceae bacterium]